MNLKLCLLVVVTDRDFISPYSLSLLSPPELLSKHLFFHKKKEKIIKFSFFLLPVSVHQQHALVRVLIGLYIFFLPFFSFLDLKFFHQLCKNKIVCTKRKMRSVCLSLAYATQLTEKWQREEKKNYFCACYHIVIIILLFFLAWIKGEEKKGKTRNNLLSLGLKIQNIFIVFYSVVRATDKWDPYIQYLLCNQAHTYIHFTMRWSCVLDQEEKEKKCAKFINAIKFLPSFLSYHLSSFLQRKDFFPSLSLFSVRVLKWNYFPNHKFFSSTFECCVCV